MTSDVPETSNDKAAKILRAMRWIYFIGLAVCAAYLAARWRDIPSEYSTSSGETVQSDARAMAFYFLGFAAICGSPPVWLCWLVPKRNYLLETGYHLLAYSMGLFSVTCVIGLTFSKNGELPKSFSIPILVEMVLLGSIGSVLMAWNVVRRWGDPRNDSKYWKWGLYYNNPDDPDLFVEGRYGWFWSPNTAHRKSRVIGCLMDMAYVVAIILLVLLVVILG